MSQPLRMPTPGEMGIFMLTLIGLAAVASAAFTAVLAVAQWFTGLSATTLVYGAVGILFCVGIGVVIGMSIEETERESL